MSGITLHGITWDHPRGYDPLVASSALYNKLSGLSIEWHKRSLTNFGDQSLPGLAKKFDLLIIDHPHVGVADETKCLLPLNQLLGKEKLNDLKNQSAGPCFSSYDYNGNQWALPIDAAMQCCSYRPELIGASLLPKNWSEVFDLAVLWKKKNLHVGMALCPTDSLCTFLTLTAQVGSPVKDGNAMLVIRDIGLQALEIMRHMRDHFHQDSLNWNPIQLYDHMSSYDDVVYAPLAFCYTNYSRPGFRKSILAYGDALDTKNAILGGAGIAVSANCKCPHEAALFAAWVCGAEIQNTIYVSAQGQPASINAWESDHANRLTHNFFSNTIDTLTNAYVRPRYSRWPAFQIYLGEVLHDWLKNDGDAVKVLDHLQDAYHQSCEQNNS